MFDAASFYTPPIYGKKTSPEGHFFALQYIDSEYRFLLLNARFCNKSNQSLSSNQKGEMRKAWHLSGFLFSANDFLNFFTEKKEDLTCLKRHSFCW